MPSTIEELEKQDLIYSMAGKGFYVKEPNRERLREENLAFIFRLHPCQNTNQRRFSCPIHSNQSRQISIEAKMMDVIRECKELGVPLEELSSIWQALYENEPIFLSRISCNIRIKSFRNTGSNPDVGSSNNKNSGS